MSSAGPSVPPASLPELEAALAEHDAKTSEDFPIWLGAEPTFTDRFSEAPEWLSEALGADKEERARQLLGLMQERNPGSLVVRALGRQYSGEPEPRWCYGLFSRRDGEPVWTGPADRLDDGLPAEADHARAEQFCESLCASLRRAGWFAARVTDAPTPRVLFRSDAQEIRSSVREDPRLGRESIHEGALLGAGVVDRLAAEGSFLLLVHPGAGGLECNELWLELPAFARVATFLEFLDRLAEACRELQLSALGLRGFTPPIDQSVAWTTLTPDPAVLEVNQAPEPNMRSFFRTKSMLFELARQVGLAPFRLHYNGDVSDSGGGGQLTIGGATPQGSPFFRSPYLLPRLIRYVIRHPSLSYWFATQYVGGSSQSPRPDEGVRESFVELGVALEQLALCDALSPQVLWSTLRHFLADASGNPHRSELNIEKLYNSYLPGRGCLGLVEFRALAMSPSVEISTARALLFRSLVAMLSREDRQPTLKHWGDELHDRFALPFYLRQDLREVFADLRATGLALGRGVEKLLLNREACLLGRAEFDQCLLTLEQGLEFWPLVGDVASQEGGGSRLVDASTSRIQLRLTTKRAASERLEALEVTANGHLLPVRTEHTQAGPCRVLGLRYRSFLPFAGLHPAMQPEKAIVLTLRSPAETALRITLHGWRPNGEAYPGLPRDAEEAAARRAERVVVEVLPAVNLAAPRVPRPEAVTPYCLDLRRLRTPTSR